MEVLLINSTQNSLLAVKKSLSHSDYSISSIDAYENAVEKIRDDNIQLVLINWGKEDYDCGDLCRKIRHIKKKYYIYIIIIASREREKELYPLISAGADDYIFRPFSTEDLFLRVKKAKKIIVLEDKVVKSKKKLMKLAKEDPLTNLLNRRALMDEALHEMGRAARDKKNISAIMFNISNLESISDFHGGIEGSGILMEISNRLKSTCRPYDKIGRYDMADFLIILPDSGTDNAVKVAERILSSLSKMPIAINEKKVILELSFGISEISPDDIMMETKKTSGGLVMNDFLLESLIKRSMKGIDRAASKGPNHIETVTE